MALILFAIAVIGATNIIVLSKLFDPIRNGYDWLLKKYSPKFIYDWLGGMLDCHQCSGFWVGLLCAKLVLSDNLGIILAGGFAGSFVADFAVNMIAAVQDFILSKTTFELPGPEKNDE